MLISSNLFSQVKQNEILSKDAKGIANFLKFKETKLESSDNAVKSFLKKQYNLNDNYEFKQKNNSLIIENGIKSQKLEQYYKGVKIAFSEIVVVSKNNNVKTINGKGLNIENINITPKLSESESLNHLLKKINAEKYAWEDNSYEELIKKETNDLLATNYPKGELVIIDKDLFDDIFEPILAYKFSVYSINPLSNSYYYINATNGKIILEDAIIKHLQGTAQTRYSGQRIIETQQIPGSYRLRDYSRGSGIETYNMNRGTNYGSASDFTDNDNNWTSAEYNNSNKDNAALDAHWGAGKTYDYFSQKHNRNSYDNNGSKIKSYVHYSNNFDNAFWDGQRMTYGDGGSVFDALTSIDVVAHEIGHGVCSHTANLVYQNESGALNEGLSDIWGAMVEYFAEPLKQTYEIGEEIRLGGGSLRSMSNPNSRNQPDTYGGTHWYSGTADHGGVHTNSGVLNYWFYLLAEGGSGTNDIGNAFNVNGIGKEKASKIVYRAESIYFTSSTTYSQARQLTIQAAEDLYGENSIESASTCQSWYAVGVGDNSCNVDIELTGNSTICNTSNYTYTLNYTPPNSSTNWSVTSGIQIINSNNSSITIKSINSSFNGMATITASISGTIIKKDIWIGKPKFTFEIEPVGINYIHVNMIGYNSSDITKQGITSTTWQKISGSGGCYSSFYGNNFFGSGNGNCNSWVAYAKITATNVCGTTTIYRNFTPPAPNPCNNITFNGQSIVIEDPCNNFNGIAGNSNSIKSILIYNLMGKQVSNNNDLSILSKGIYIIKVELTTGEILTKKIIK